VTIAAASPASTWRTPRRIEAIAAGNQQGRQVERAVRPAGFQVAVDGGRVRIGDFARGQIRRQRDFVADLEADNFIQSFAQLRIVVAQDVE